MRWIVFDYGEVICHRTTELPKVASLLGVPQEVMEPAYWDLRDPYDRGWTDLEYWTELGSRIGISVDERQAAALTATDVAGWLSVNDGTLTLLDDLAAAGYSLGLLSNAPASHGRVFRRQPWAERFEHLVISGELGFAKPDAEIWAALVERLGADPAECVFLDDKQVNVAGAEAAGLHAHHWTGVEVARRRLAELGVL
jgi:putative hydrolase of the HAD superfamily